MDTRTIHRWARMLSVVVLLALASGTLAGQAASEAAGAMLPAQAAAPSMTAPQMPQMPQTTQAPDTSLAPSPAPAASAYAHREARVPTGAAAPPAAPSGPESPDGGDQTLHVIVGRSVFVSTPERMRRVYISNPTVIESMTPSPTDLVITAKTAGTSSVVVWDESGNSTVFTVMSDVDVGGLRQSLSQALPEDQVNVEVQEGKLFLSGVVGSDAEGDIASKLASVYSKEIVNSLVVDPRHRPQVELKVRFAELDRSKLDAFGVNLFGLNSSNVGSGSTQQFGAPSFQTGGGSSGETATFSDFLNLFYFNIKNGVGASLKDLQTKGILEVLAEPTLMTIDGQPAKFLAGGEFPFPVVQPGSAGGTATVTIQFRQFGVKLEFVPFVNPDGTIRLKVSPEVSALDYSNVVVIAGYTIPSLSTRRAETEVELKDGQTFGISGILDHRTTDSLNRMPGIADVPILGQLFRSKSLNHSVMELIVVVTPTIVNPLTSDQPAPPNPKWVVPPGQLGNFDKNLPRSYNQKQ
ncbi:MAG: pilus assembly protein N-terminal domain-containing protein [Candidatus Korobacteraceae bacterium]